MRNGEEQFRKERTEMRDEEQREERFGGEIREMRDGEQREKERRATQGKEER